MTPTDGTPVLIAEDDDVSRRLLVTLLKTWGHEAVVTTNGDAAWQVLESENAPRLAILDWGMPGMTGIEIARRLRESPESNHPYVILLTARHDRSDVLAGLQAGVDDYVTKPFDSGELHARLLIGVRTVALRDELAGRVKELEEALAQVQQLEGLLPMCAWCKKIRDGEEYWQDVEQYVAARSKTRFTHSICPDCREKYAVPAINKARRLRLEREA